jgi:hypothetical protein
LAAVVLDRWNVFAKAHGFAQAKTLTGARKRAMHARVAEKGFLAAVDDALKFLAASEWHRANPIGLDTFLRAGKAEQYAEKLATVRSSRSRSGARREVDDKMAGALADGVTGRRTVGDGEGWGREDS